MPKTLNSLAMLLVLAAPAALAHIPPGPDGACTGPNQEHDYNLATSLIVNVPPYVGAGTTLVGDGNLEDCNSDGIPLDFDGETEWGIGGALLAVDSGDGLTYGSIACYLIAGHHPSSPTITVTDILFPDVFFTVGADYSLVPPSTGPDCGDGLINPTTNPLDQIMNCVNSCVPLFPPGIDGSYWVFVDYAFDVPTNTAYLATSGHISTGVATPQKVGGNVLPMYQRSFIQP